MKNSHPIFILCLAIEMFCSGCAFVQQGAIERAQDGIKKKNYVFALERLKEAESYTTPTPAVGAQIDYMKGVCYEEMDSPDEANAMFKFVADRYPDTEYGYMAKEKLTNSDVFMSITGPAVIKQYDERFVKLVKERWDSLLETNKENQNRTGKVVIKFNLQKDGTITNLKVVKNTATDLLASICQKALLDSGPYESWTPDILKANDKPYRSITFTFNYCR